MEFLLGLAGGYVLARTCHDRLVEVCQNVKAAIRKICS